MPSPDVSPYVSLALFDLTPQSIYDNAVNNLVVDLPDWVPREGNVEVVLLENLSLMLSEGIFTVNRLPSAITEILAKLFGITRDAGAPPTCTLEFTMVNNAGYTIPAGTRVILPVQVGQVTITFSTNVDLVIAPGNLTGQVLATGDIFTALANGTNNTLVNMLESSLYVDQVEIVVAVADGRAPESDLDYFSRATTKFSRLNDTLVTPSDFRARTLEQDQSIYYRAEVYDNWDGSGGGPGSDPGHVTIAVYGPSGTVSSPNKTALQTLLAAQAASMLSVHVIDPTVTTVAVTSQIVVESGFVSADVIQAVEDRLTEYLNTDTWPWGDTVYRNELISVIDQVPGVKRVNTLTTPATDTVLSGVANLVTVGTLTITAL